MSGHKAPVPTSVSRFPANSVKTITAPAIHRPYLHLGNTGTVAIGSGWGWGNPCGLSLVNFSSGDATA